MSDKPNPWPSGKFGCPDGRPSDLVEQFEPGYAFRETGLWCGMTREEVEAFLAERRAIAQQEKLDAKRLKQLRHWTPLSLPC